MTVISSNPYKNLDDFHFWRRCVANVDQHLFDPVVAPKFKVSDRQLVATAGSCFAQHISRKLASINFNYFVPEDAPGLDAATRKSRNYGVFSARYGNIYTVRQLLQLFHRAYGRFVPQEQAWIRPDGKLVDPYRPGIEPDGFDDPEQLAADREAHLAAVRAMFERTDVFVFTMGLTEGWRSRADGAVFPLAPGVVAGDFNPGTHEFVNFGVHETEQDMAEFLDLLKALNPGVKVLLTVSPVPLVATYEHTNVLVATTYSKSVLRVAAETLSRSYDWVDYFPSFEIITGSYNAGAYYEDDHREVTETGVAHAMRCFMNNYLENYAPPERDAALWATNEAEPVSDIVCDEEAIDQVAI